MSIIHVLISEAIFWFPPPYPFIRAFPVDCPPWFQCLPWTTGPALMLELCFGRAFGTLASRALWAASPRWWGSEWPGAGETFAPREGPVFLRPYSGKEKWFMSEYGHILLIKPTQKRQHCNIFQWLFIMNYVSLRLNCYYFSLMLLGACIIYSIGSCRTMK